MLVSVVALYNAAGPITPLLYGRRALMKRILLLVTVASMLAAAMALSGVAQARPIADSADAQCATLAIKTLGPSYNPSNYTFIGGTADADGFSLEGTADGPDVFCGFGGDDQIGVGFALDEGDIFLGGAGNDEVDSINYGTFYGGAGNDEVDSINYGTFYGGAGNDYVDNNEFGTFYGGPGDDTVGSGQPPVEEP
jgi:opacity protein-like surface antigen